MTKNEQVLAKVALQVIDSAGSAGICREALLTQLGVMADRPISTSEGAALIALLQEHDWVVRYTDPITETPRYILSGKGSVAKGAL